MFACNMMHQFIDGFIEDPISWRHRYTLRSQAGCVAVGGGRGRAEHARRWREPVNAPSARPQRSMPATPAPPVFRLQGGTGKHIDGDVAEPLNGRPFQAYVQLSDAAENDGSLQVLPGFHATAQHYFERKRLQPPAGGFTPLTQDDHSELLDSDLWVPVRRLPKRWRQLHAAGNLPAPSAAPQARGVRGIVKALKTLARELQGDLKSAELPRAGDYVMWDPRLPHSTGEPSSFSMHSQPRQVFYCAYMMAGECVSQAAEQRACRQTGLHLSWSPASHRFEEMTPAYAASHLSPLGQHLYGHRPRGGGAQSGALDESAVAGEVAFAAGWHDAWSARDGGMTDAHVAFFQRYGYVVIDGTLDSELVWRIASQVRAHLLARHGIDCDDVRNTLTEKRLRSAFSPDGSGMLELYWLPAMEEARQSAALLRLTQRLYSRTWGAAARGFRLATAAAAQPQLAIYVDRTSLRLPGACLLHLLEGVPCTIKVRLPEPRWLFASKHAAEQEHDIFYVERLLSRREVLGRAQFLVRWQTYGAEYDTWEDEANIIDRSLIDGFNARERCDSLLADAGDKRPRDAYEACDTCESFNTAESRVNSPKRRDDEFYVVSDVGIDDRDGVGDEAASVIDDRDGVGDEAASVKVDGYASEPTFDHVAPFETPPLCPDTHGMKQGFHQQQSPLRSLATTTTYS